MPITVTCDDCSETHRVRDDAVGKRLKCKGCGKSLRIEAPDSPQVDFPDLDDIRQDDDGDDEAETSQFKPARRKAKPAAQRGKSSRSGTGKSTPVPLRKTMVPLGIRLVYIGFMLFLFAMFLATVIPWTNRNNPRGLVSFLPFLLGLFFLIQAASLITTVGKVMCLTAPPRMSGKGVILVAVAIDLLAQSIAVAKMFTALPPVLISSINLLSVAGMVCFVLFLKHLGRFLKEPDIAERATALLGLGVVVVGMWLSIIALGALAIARVLPAIVGGSGILLLGIALLIVGIIGTIRYAGLLNSCLYAMSYES